MILIKQNSSDLIRKGFYYKRELAGYVESHTSLTCMCEVHGVVVPAAGRRVRRRRTRYAQYAVLSMPIVHSRLPRFPFADGWHDSAGGADLMKKTDAGESAAFLQCLVTLWRFARDFKQDCDALSAVDPNLVISTGMTVLQLSLFVSLQDKNACWLQTRESYNTTLCFRHATTCTCQFFYLWWPSAGMSPLHAYCTCLIRLYASNAARTWRGSSWTLRLNQTRVRTAYNWP